MIARPHLGPTANDNPAPVAASPFTVTEMTLMAFGPGLFCAIVVSALFLVKVW